MGGFGTFAGYGVYQNNYSNEACSVLKKYGFVPSYYKEDENKDEISEKVVIPNANEKGDIGIYEPYESDTPFLGYFYDDAAFINGLPFITDDDKTKVHEMYDNLNSEVKKFVSKPNWVFVAHYE